MAYKLGVVVLMTLKTEEATNIYLYDGKNGSSRDPKRQRNNFM